MFYILLFITKKATHPKNIIDDQLFKLMSIFNDIELVLVNIGNLPSETFSKYRKFSHGEGRLKQLHENEAV